jgi:hypothetical protein
MFPSALGSCHATFHWAYALLMRRLMRISLLTAAFVLAFPGIARSEDARVLPQGRSRLSLIYAQSAEITKTFNSRNEAESLTAPYNMDLSQATLAKVEPAIREAVSVLNNMGWRYNAREKNGANHGLTRDPSYPALGDILSRGFLNIDAQAKREQYYVAYQYGMTDRLSVGFMIPYMRTQVDVSHGLSGENTAETAYAALKSSGAGFSPRLLDALDQMRTLNDEKFQQMLVERGYTRFESSDVSGVGDAVVGARYNYLSTSGGLANAPGWTNSIQAGFSAPTGKLKHPSQLTRTDFGTGTWDLAVAHLTNYAPSSWITFSQGLHYTYRVPNTRLMRVRHDANDFVPDASGDETLDQRLGDKYSATLGTQLNFTSAFSMNADYEWWWKRADRYAGKRADRDYGWLSDNTESYTENLEVGASVSTIPAFLRHEIFVPMSVTALIHLPLRGKNSIITPYATAEVALYF